MSKVSTITKNVGRRMSKHSPLILTITSVVGVAGTVIFSARAGIKAERILQEELGKRFERTQTHGVDENNYVIPINWKEKIKLTWRCYIPSAIIGGTTIACIIGGNKIRANRYAAVASVATMTETAFKEYRNKVAETIGKNKELKVRDDICADKVKTLGSGTNEVIFTGKGNVLCYDCFSGREFESSHEEIRRVINDLNEQLIHEGYVSLNDFYYGLGLRGIKPGDNIGWHIDAGVINVRFSSNLTNENKPCLVLDYECSTKY